MKTFYLTLGGLALTLSSWAFSSPKEEHVLNLPPRPEKALSGTAFLKKIESMSPAKRENAFVKEILRGNVPNFLRQLTPVDTKLKSGLYKGQTMRFWALPDYIAVGSDTDFVRVPLNMHSIQQLNEKLDMNLPTRKMVDVIYSQAQVKLKPSPVPYSPAVASTGNILKHHFMVQKQLDGRQLSSGLLVAGHKKDVVQSRRLAKKPGSIAIYGWHKLDMRPIQPLSTVHSADYADYSHGIRLVASHVQVGSRSMNLQELLSEKKTAILLSDEGTIARATKDFRKVKSKVKFAKAAPKPKKFAKAAPKAMKFAKAAPKAPKFVIKNQIARVP